MGEMVEGVTVFLVLVFASLPWVMFVLLIVSLIVGNTIVYFKKPLEEMKI